MMRDSSRRWAIGVSVAVAAVLAGCGEKPQGMGGIKSDTAPYKGTGVATFTQSGWQAGDANAWSQQLKARAQYGQNEYSRATQR